MPHFTLQLTPQGPVLNAVVLVSSMRNTALVAAGQPVPSPVTIRALVDTGASGTCIDPSVLASLSLTPTGSTPISTPSTGGTPVSVDQYDVSIMIPAAANQPPLVFDTIPVLGTELASQGIQALIGRDMLGLCLLYYDGASGTFTLAY